MSDIKCPPPRQLQHEETLASLDSFQSAFKLYFKRSRDLKEFFKPGAAWDPNCPNYGLTDTQVEGRVTASHPVLVLLDNYWRSIRQNG